MSVLLETSAGDIVIDLLVDDAPQTCLNFLKLCKVKYYNFSPVYNVQRDFSFQTGDPIGPGQSGSDGGSSIWGKLQGASKKYFESEFSPKLKHSERGTVSMATAPAGGDDDAKRISGSQFLITLGDSLDYLDGKGSIFGRVVEGFDTLEAINSAFCDDQGWPLKDIRIRHTIILDDPFDDPPGLVEPPESPIPTKEQLATVRIGEDEDLNEEADEETAEMQRREREARAQALTLEMVGDLPFADVKPPENVLFVCKLNPVTQDEDLELIFSRFGKILSCEVIRDQRTGDSLQYAFIEFETQQNCEQAYFKMDGVLIDDHRIHVDFSQSVSKLSDSWRMDTNAKRRAYADSKGYGGSSQLQKKQQYKSGDGGSLGKKYDMVFDSFEQSRSSKDRGAPRGPGGDWRAHRGRDSNGYRDRNQDWGRDKHADGRSHKYRRSRSRSTSPRRRDHDRRERGHDRDKDRNSGRDRRDRYERR
ncbi:Peptidyl-prolyl cis-trans isomerase cyp6 [Orbilia oligospora]|uniref:Peptidyl-prolyl cis-trans isomerase n=1 Tax=Orbilia oligospora TaxID=2813651 RepID=A0A7C8JAK0_ORBOL|nr:Peptidyl-prolyl cis-trans isomerase cyp6 [Orbilia oligospora]KAF3096045.1 Peptidyl-prolyl cis-trans isomerase cyp6 [Orbilia oligospora]KAF3106451.1 Peptidyl-prolyl cis-trans isomerase cyp6 [Orbilia oligospora]KAF3131872.1 Peptidyl-prolyl cis-trans isomerase cyp6 [Orbilia oligospora]KAF3131971.1 Peptidyl-prolyl cis-trans isomerase cyp6 [Orbilia oligospora]